MKVSRLNLLRWLSAGTALTCFAAGGTVWMTAQSYLAHWVYFSIFTVSLSTLYLSCQLPLPPPSSR